MDLSVVVVSWNTRDHLERCLRALEEDPTSLEREVLVVDNASEDGSADLVRKAFPSVRLLAETRNTGYAAGNNRGIRASSGTFVCLLNSDAVVGAGALERLVAFLRGHATYAAAAPLLRNPDGSLQRACMRFPGLATAVFFDTLLDRRFPGNRVVARYFMRDFDHLHARDVEQPPGSCLVLRRAALDAVGLFDEELFLFFNDVDLCLRLWRSGWRIRYLPEAEVVHARGASTGRYDRFVVEWHRNRLAYYRKHYGPLGAGLVRFVVAARALEESFRIRRRLPPGEGRRAEMRRLRAAVREVLGGGRGLARSA